jgi:hypothetical protein
MAEFISKELAMSMPWANGKYDKENANEHFIYGLETYKEWLKSLPIANVAEVKHAHWANGICTNCGIEKPVVIVVTEHRMVSDMVYQYQGELN